MWHWKNRGFFAFEKSGVIPDILPIAKGIGGGFPIGAVLMTKKVSKSMSPGSHGSTFGGNPNACAVGLEVMKQIFKKGFLKNVKIISKYFHQELKKIQLQFPKIIKVVRGRGLLIGFYIKINLNLLRNCKIKNY